MKPPMRLWRERWHRLTGRKTTVLDGVTLHTRGNGIPPEVTRLLQRGEYEFAERKLLLRVLTPSDRVLEVGAGIGALGLVAARICGAANVLSFEADPDTLPVIEANQALNDLYPAVRASAVTADGGPLTFYRMGNIISSSVIDRGNAEAITVESERLDDLIAEFAPTILLMDAEGAELELLRNADLSSLRAMVIETHAKITGDDSVVSLKRIVTDAGFRIVEDVNKNILCVRG